MIPLMQQSEGFFPCSSRGCGSGRCYCMATGSHAEHTCPATCLHHRARAGRDSVGHCLQWSDYAPSRAFRAPQVAPEPLGTSASLVEMIQVVFTATHSSRWCSDCMQKHLSSHVSIRPVLLWLQQLRKDEKAADRLKSSEESVSKDSGEYGERGKKT